MINERKVRIFIGNIAHCVSVNCIRRCGGECLTYYDPGYVAVAERKIISAGAYKSLDEIKEKLPLTDNSEIDVIKLKESQILIPGFIDTHIHAPQYPNCGLGYDKTLLEWLKTYTYPMEVKYKDLEFSRRIFDAVVRKTLSLGTTTATYYGCLFNSANMVLVDSVIKYGQRALIGKVNMTTLAPSDYVETPEESIKYTKEFVEHVLSKKNDLIKPIITPRFALSVDLDVMKNLADIAEKHKLHIQSHISENVDEIEMVKLKYNLTYADTYDSGRLLTNYTVLAHGVHLSDDEMKLLAKKGSSISHCPASNTCLRSGMCDVRKLWHHRVSVGLGTDISGGPTPSIISAMRSALDNSVHLSVYNKNHKPLDYKDAFFLATLGGAQALRMDDVIGNFEAGKDFDALIVDMDVNDSQCEYLHECDALELLQKFVYTGDDRNVVKVFVAGRQLVDKT